MLVIMNKLELVIALRKIAEHRNCHLTLRAASAIADWLKEGTPFYIASISDYLKYQEQKKSSQNDGGL